MEKFPLRSHGWKMEQKCLKINGSRFCPTALYTSVRWKASEENSLMKDFISVWQWTNMEPFLVKKLILPYQVSVCLSSWVFDIFRCYILMTSCFIYTLALRNHTNIKNFRADIRCYLRHAEKSEKNKLNEWLRTKVKLIRFRTPKPVEVAVCKFNCFTLWEQLGVKVWPALQQLF